MALGKPVFFLYCYQSKGFRKISNEDLNVYILKQQVDVNFHINNYCPQDEQFLRLIKKTFPGKCTFSFQFHRNKVKIETDTEIENKNEHNPGNPRIEFPIPYHNIEDVFYAIIMLIELQRIIFNIHNLFNSLHGRDV